MNNDMFTKELPEKIYSFSSYSDDDEINTIINSFFQELIARKRGIAMRDGLQAAMCILNDSCAMKVCDNDGIANHIQSFTNLLKFLSGDNNYVKPSEIRYYIETEEYQDLSRNRGIDVYFHDGNDELIIRILASINLKTKFQVNILEKLLKMLLSLKKMKTYKNINVGLGINREYFSDEDIGIEEHFTRLLEAIHSQDELINKVEK